MFSRLSADLVIKILALGSTWPHMFVRLTCIQFNRLSSAVRAAAKSQTLVVASHEGVWIMNQERGCWVACAPLPKAALCIHAGVSCGGEVMLLGQGPDGKSFMVAFEPKLNTWRELPTPFDTTDLLILRTHMAKLDC